MGGESRKAPSVPYVGAHYMKPILRENAHMFENLIQILESVILILEHHPRSTPADFHGKIRPPVPGIDLAHTGEI